MCHDGTWASTFEMMLTALIFDCQVISLADKPGSLWPFCTKRAVESYRYPHYEMMGKDIPIFIYCHAIHAPLKPQQNDRHLNHFAYLKPFDVRSENTKKYVYYGGGETKLTGYSILNTIITNDDDSNSKCSMEKQLSTPLYTSEIDVAHQLLVLMKNPIPKKNSSVTLYSKLLQSKDTKKIDSGIESIREVLPLIPDQSIRTPPKKTEVYESYERVNY